MRSRGALDAAAPSCATQADGTSTSPRYRLHETPRSGSSGARAGSRLDSDASTIRGPRPTIMCRTALPERTAGSAQRCSSARSAGVKNTVESPLLVRSLSADRGPAVHTVETPDAPYAGSTPLPGCPGIPPTTSSIGATGDDWRRGRALAPWECWAASDDAAGMCREFLLGAPHGIDPDLLAHGSRMVDREKALRWVDALPTRGGLDRSHRIQECGWMEVCVRPPGVDSDLEVGYRQRFCRDRACPACAVIRSVTIRDQLREHLVERESGESGDRLFVGLTHPKFPVDAESPGHAVTRALKEWAKLRKRRPFQRSVAGYVRAVECVWIARGWKHPKGGRPYFVKGSGWHAHLHIMLELEPGVCPWRFEAWCRTAWKEIAGASDLGMDFHDFSDAKIPELAKYITKPFELPERYAPTFFREMAGRHLIYGGGTWKHYAQHDVNPPTGWVPQARHVAELIDDARKKNEITFRWVEDEDGKVRDAVYKPAGDDEIPRHVVMPAREALARLLEDARTIRNRGHPT